MPAVCLYFQVHQPFRLRKFSFFEAGSGADYFDHSLDELVMKRAAERCYLPANQALLDQVSRLGGSMKVAFSITGTAIEQMRLYAPEALDSFKALAETGHVEFLGETYFHSLASLVSLPEFRRQVELHRALIEAEFRQAPRVFRNTELLCSEEIAREAKSLGFSALVAEGSEQVLGWRSPNGVFESADAKLPLILRNYRLSDDIAFRFASGDGPGRPLTAASFARRLSMLPPDTDSVGLFVDYETFGEHYASNSTVLKFLAELPEALLAQSGWSFVCPSELAMRSVRRDTLPLSSLSSWADEAKDASAWTGNSLQESCLARLYALEPKVLAAGDEGLLAAWRRLQTSDHFYYMSTKSGGDGSVHSYFSPFGSPYEAFIAFMNVARDLEQKLG